VGARQKEQQHKFKKTKNIFQLWARVVSYMVKWRVNLDGRGQVTQR